MTECVVIVKWLKMNHQNQKIVFINEHIDTTLLVKTQYITDYKDYNILYWVKVNLLN